MTEQYGEELAKTAIKKITNRARDLQKNPDLGVDLSARYDIDIYFKAIYVNHNHLFYYIDDDTIIIAEMFGEKKILCTNCLEYPDARRSQLIIGENDTHPKSFSIVIRDNKMTIKTLKNIVDAFKPFRNELLNPPKFAQNTLFRKCICELE